MRETGEAIVRDVVDRDATEVEVTVGIVIPDRYELKVYIGSKGARRHLGRIPEKTLTKETKVVA